MHTYFLRDLAIVMASAGAMTLLCHRLKQPVVIGYLLAGLFIGPYTPPFPMVSDLNSIHTMAELGLVFLMFALGLEFNLPKIQKVGMSAGLAALLEVAGMLIIGYLLGQAFGWSRMDSIFLGAILCVSSTTIIVKVFMDFKMMGEKFVQVVFGILVLEDIVAVAILSILSGLGTQGGPDATAILASFLRIGLFVILFLVAGLLFIPRFVHWVAEFKEKEVLGVVTLGVCLSGAYLASLFNLSIALGAFLGGAVLAASEEIEEIEEWIHPVRDMFSAIFFVSAGMLIQPDLLWKYKIPIFVITGVTLIGKVISGAFGSFVAGYDLKTSARVGMSLAQIGEFSFVIASLGLTLKVTGDFLYPLAVTVSSLTTLATPYLIRNSDRLVDIGMQSLPARWRDTLSHHQEKRDMKKSAKPAGHATAILSKYLVRLAVYIAILIVYVLITQIGSSYLAQSLGEHSFKAGAVIVFWAIAAVLSLPLLMAITKYLNHFILLMVTSNKWILQRLNIHLFYNTLYAVVMFFLGLAFLFSAARFFEGMDVLAAMATGVTVFGVLCRRLMARGREGLEKILDHVTGLATSEPTRQAVLKSTDKGLLLHDITDQITLPPNSLSQNKSLRDLRLREQTGASVVAIYREGEHIANPNPDIMLNAHDVLILLGNQQELEKARAFLLAPPAV